MSRRRRRSDAPPEPSAPRNAAARWLGPALALVVVAAALVAWLALHRDAGSARIAAAPAPDTLAALPAKDAYLTAVRLMQEKRCVEALPYFRRAVQDPGSEFAQLHFNYAGAIYNTMFGNDTLATVAHPAWRTSEERVAMMRECTTQFLRAYQLASSPAEKAFYANRLGRVLQAWGFAWEAFAWYSEAAQQQPQNELFVRQARGFQQLMADPHSHPVGPVVRATRP